MKKIICLVLSLVMCLMPLTVHAQNIASGDISCSQIITAPKGYNDSNISYNYETTENGFEKIVGFQYLNEYYKFVFDDHGVIVGLKDSKDENVAGYLYDEYGVLEQTYSYENGIWMENDDPDFVGNYNKRLWLGRFYDVTTGYYYYDHGEYYDPVTERFIGRTSSDGLLTDYNPFVPTNTRSALTDIYEIEYYAEQWAESLLNSEGFGRDIPYTSGWYTSVSDVELLARAIYGEAGNTYTLEENAVAHIILNRINSSEFPNTARGVITDVSSGTQFSTVRGNEGGSKPARIIFPDEDAYNYDSSMVRWRHATFLACLMYTTHVESEWDQIVGNPIWNQEFFYSFTSAKNAYNAGNSVFTGSGDNMKYENTPIKDVYVLGYGIVTSFSDLFASYSPGAWSRNIYYNYNN